jgi:hypothetical protein
MSSPDIFSLDKPEKAGYAETMARNGKQNGKRKAGQPTKITDALIAKVCDLIEEGNFIDTAAVCAGISYGTYYNWHKWGDRKSDDFRGGAYEKFFKAVKDAERRGEYHILQCLFDAEGKNWIRYAWVLERRFPGKWGRRYQQLPASQAEDGVKGIEQTQEALRTALGDPKAAHGAEAMQKFLDMNGDSARAD